MIAETRHKSYIGSWVIGSALAPRDNLTSGPTVRFPLGRALPDSGASGDCRMHIQRIPQVLIDELRGMTVYNSDTGNLLWSLPADGKAVRRCIPGRPVGTPHRNGYLRFQYKGSRHMTHRLVWDLHFGSIPDGMLVDHIDGDKANNRLENLRIVSHSVNAQNQCKAHKQNATGLLGVRPGYNSKRHGQRWIAYIGTLDGITKRRKAQIIGTSFTSPEEAHQAYLEAKRRLHPGCTI